ncbi:MFS transporter [Actinocorallia populi]|uniref:MFS transporter n=1 Tax=Actinocorallia populi TaxID=2079200 RepID=UPI000D086DFB|nr:MFS transporter [Actinocorallia populi]
MISTTPPDAPEKTSSGVLSRTFLWTTIGSFALVFLAAFESVAVTAVMPAVSADLDGARLYAAAFAGPLATGVIGMVAGGMWADRRGPVAPLYASVALFSVGLVVCGLAPSMEALVAGRLLQGLGGGALTVTLYVVVARVYPEELHPKIFAWFAAAWVVPALVGPAAAGAVTDLLSWHWVFLGVVVLVALAMLMVVPSLGGLGPGEPAADDAGRGPRLLVWATLAALAVLALNLVSEIPRVGGLLVLASVAATLVAVRPLLPAGTLRARRGLPSVVLMRGMGAAAFFGADVYLPYLFTERYGFSPTLAGLTLTLGALAWSGASAVQGRLGERLPHALAVRIGMVLVFAAILPALLAALLGLHPAVPIAGWTVGGAGMGLMYPRLSTLVLGLSTPANRGFNSSAMSIADSLGGALTLALAGIVFASFATGSAGGFAAVFAFAALIGLVAALLAHRVSPGTGNSPKSEVIS